MFETIISFGEDIVVSDETLKRTSKAILDVIKKELPEEAQVYSVVKDVLKRSLELAEGKTIML